MTFETEFVSVTEALIDELGGEMTYLSDRNGVETTVVGLFDRTPIAEETEDGSVLHYSASLSMKYADLPIDAGEGDTITRSAIDYTVRVIELDGLGEARLLLSEL